MKTWSIFLQRTPRSARCQHPSQALGGSDSKPFPSWMSWMSWFTLSPFGSRAVTAKSCLSTPLSTPKRGYSRHGRLVGNIAWVWACIRGPKRQGSLARGVVALADGFFRRASKGGHRDRIDRSVCLSGFWVLFVMFKC